MSHYRALRAVLISMLGVVAWLMALVGITWTGPNHYAQAATNTFSNMTAFSVGPGAGPASVYPSTISVSGLTTTSWM